MGRLGVWHQEALAFIEGLLNFSCLSLKGIYTHFPSADTDRRFTKIQIQQLSALIAALDRRGLVIPYVHAANSMGLAVYPSKILNLARAGLMLYGLYPSQKLEKNQAAAYHDRQITDYFFEENSPRPQYQLWPHLHRQEKHDGGHSAHGLQRRLLALFFEQGRGARGW